MSSICFEDGNSETFSAHKGLWGLAVAGTIIFCFAGMQQFQEYSRGILGLCGTERTPSIDFVDPIPVSAE